MTKEQILLALGNMLDADQINTDAEDLYDASADRYKKYAKAKKVLNNPIPTAIVYPKNTEEVRELLMFCNENGINVIPRSGKTATEGGLENWKELADDKDVTEEIYMYVSEDYTVHHEFDSEGLIGGKYLMSKEKFGGTAFGWNGKI